MSISIALCTYNGEKYIQEQLESIFQQSIKPIEIIICDDNSTDNTVSIIKKIQENSPIPISLHINSFNEGVKKNFVKAISLCQGDYIALSDQDDYWLPKKLEKLVNALTNNPSKEVVFSNLRLVDENLNELNSTMWDYVVFDERLKKIWNNGGAYKILTVIGSKVTGCSMLFSTKYIKNILPSLINNEYNPNLIHDRLISLIAAKEDKITFVDECLVLYRQHSQQVVGTGYFFRGETKKRNIFQVIKDFQSLESLLIQRQELQKILETKLLIISSFKEYNYEIDATTLKNEVLCLEERINYPKHRIKRLGKIIENYRNKKYQLYSHSVIKCVLKDIFVIK